MLCQRCMKNTATVRYAEVVDGNVDHVHLCEGCLEEVQAGAVLGFELARDVPASTRSQKPLYKSSAADPLTSLETCRTCGTDLATVLDSQQVGCSVCYDSFSEQLDTVLEDIHTTAFHRGKIPKLDDYRARIRAELHTKRALMRSALKMENYEEAASLRDEIKALEDGLDISEMGAD